MNKVIIQSAILSSIRLISNEMENKESEEQLIEFELTLAELNLALKELEIEWSEGINGVVIEGFTGSETLT